MENQECTYRISVKAIIKDPQGRILLIKESDGSWEFPGGGLEHGENYKDGLKREVAEEIGCSIEWVADNPSSFWTIKKDVGADDLKWFGFVLYETKITGELKLGFSSEAHEARYFEFEEATKLELHDNIKPYFQTKNR